MFEEIFMNVLFQVGMFIVFIYAFGYVISLCNKMFYKVTGNGMAMCVATGLIGTPIHEISHAIMCIVFGHKIEEIRLFAPDTKTGVLGYVNHSYNRKNLFHVLGNYFIGVAPIVVGSCFIYLMLYLLIPATFEELVLVMGDLAAFQVDFNENIFVFGLNVFTEALTTIFTIYECDFKIVIFFVVCLCIALHMNLSSADIKGSLGALPILILLIVILNVVMYFLTDSVYFGFLETISLISAYLIAMLSLSLVFSLIIFALGLVIGLIKKLIFRR